MSKLEYVLTPSCSFFLSSEKDSCWNLPMCVEIKRPYDIAAMRIALNRVIAENDAVRCIVSGRREDGVYTVRFLEDVSAEPEMMKIMEDDYEKAREKAVRAAEEFAEEPVDVYNGIPLRIKCFIVSDSAFLLTVVIHHFAADAVGLAAIGGRIVSYYLNGCNSLSESRAGQFSDYLWKCEELTVSDKYEVQLKYWKKELEGLELSAAKDKFISKALEHEHYFTIGRDMAYEFARGNNSTVFNVILLAVNLLYAELFDTADTIAGFVSSDRRDPEFMAAAGNYTRMLGARLKLERNMTFREALRKLMTKTVYGVENAAAGDNILSLPIYISYQEEHQARQFSGAGDIKFIGVSIPRSTPCMMMSVIEKKDVIGIVIAADRDRYSDTFIANCGRRLTEIVRDMVLTSGKRLGDYLPESVFNNRVTELIMI